MLTIPGYRIDEMIHQSAHCTVYRGLSQEDDRPVVLKITRGIPLKPSEIARFNHEYEIVEKFYGASNRWFNRLSHEDRLILVTEDIGARSLANHLAQTKLNVSSFLGVAIKIAEKLADIHEHGIVHKDINPHNIIWNQETGALQTIDFNISTTLRQEVPIVRNPSGLEGTLSYLAPEQTGRMSRSIDYRADLYSLGATLHELLTGRPPFTNKDVTELVHAHLAVTPTSPNEIDRNIPPVLSAIVMKLMNKEPAERYQSAQTLLVDLRQCQHKLTNTSTIEPFEIAANDVTDVFRLPGRLYGRDQEISALQETFEKVSQGALSMTLVAGYSGIGKSVLVHELYRPITQKRGHFISGKFDQYQRSIPYSAVVAAFQEMVREILTEPEAKLAGWLALRAHWSAGAQRCHHHRSHSRN